VWVKRREKARREKRKLTAPRKGNASKKKQESRDPPRVQDGVLKKREIKTKPVRIELSPRGREGRDTVKTREWASPSPPLAAGEGGVAKNKARVHLM